MRGRREQQTATAAASSSSDEDWVDVGPIIAKAKCLGVTDNHGSHASGPEQNAACKEGPSDDEDGPLLEENPEGLTGAADGDDNELTLETNDEPDTENNTDEEDEDLLLEDNDEGLCLESNQDEDETFELQLESNVESATGSSNDTKRKKKSVKMVAEL